MKMIKVRSNLKTAPKGAGVYLHREREKLPGKKYGPWTLWRMEMWDRAGDWKADDKVQEQFIGPLDIKMDDPNEPQEMSDKFAQEIADAPVIESPTDGMAPPSHWMATTTRILQDMREMLAQMVTIAKTAQEPRSVPIVTQRRVDEGPRPKGPTRPASGALRDDSNPAEPMDPRKLRVAETMFRKLNLKLPRVAELMQKPIEAWLNSDWEHLMKIHRKYSGVDDSAAKNGIKEL